MSCLQSTPAQQTGSQPRRDLPEANPYSSAADLEAGRRLFTGRCGHCHGQNGEGGRGATLNTGRFRRGNSDREIFLIIRNGIPDTEMPGTFNSPEADIWRMVAHVQQLGRQGLPAESVTGDAAAGALVYEDNRCGLCHSIDGKGGFLGPDLSDIGAKRALWHLRQSLLEPSADIPLDYRTVEVISAAGKNRGIHLNEDEYSVHMREGNGNLRSFMKSEINEIKLPGVSLMPAYTALPKDELENLVAYLSSLRGKRRMQ